MVGKMRGELKSIDVGDDVEDVSYEDGDEDEDEQQQDNKKNNSSAK